MNNEEFLALCKKTVMDYFNEHADKTDHRRGCIYCVEL